MNELVSVIVTNYNHAEFLPQRVESILSQTYKNIEIIIVDDCSTDNSRDVYKSFSKYPNIRIELLKANMGYANASNSGVRLSRGELIMFAEADDYDEPNHIETLIRHIGGTDKTGVVFCRNNIVDENGKKICDDYQNMEPSIKRYCSKDTLIPSMLMQRFLLKSCIIPNMSAVLFRKKYFNMIGGLSPAFKVCADWDFWCRMSSVCDFYYVAEHLNNFRRHTTTLRAVFGIKPQFSEIFQILNTAAQRAGLTKPEQIKFKLNLGYMFAHEAVFSHKKNIKNFLQILRYGREFGNQFFLCFLFGFSRSFLDLFLYAIKNHMPKNNPLR